MTASPLDVAVIAVYLIGITAFGIWIGYRRGASTQQYFLANRSLSWFTVGAAVFTSNISTIHLVGLAAGGANEGIVIGNFEWMACFILIILALVFAPFYLNSRVATLPEFMERRYCPAARTFLAVIGLIGALLIHIGISLFAAAKLFESFLGIPMIVTIVALSVFTLIYTALGGLKAVVMTENIQVILLLLGAALVTILGLRALSGVGVHDYAAFKAAVSPEHLHMLRPITNAQGHLDGYSWLAVLLGYPILGIWYWCADQTLVQRVLGARSLRDAQNGALFAGFLKITPVFLMVLPGLIGLALWQKGEIQLGSIAEGGAPDFNTMLPVLINYLLPAGLRGLLAATLAAALMSTMAAALNGCATLISMDVLKRIDPGRSDASVVRAGRITTVVVMILAMLWSTQGDQFGTIFEAVNKIPMTFAPAVTTVFVFGVLWKRGTWQAAMTTLYVGSIIGVCYFFADLPGIGRIILGEGMHEGFRGLVTDSSYGLGIPFMLVGPIITIVCIAIYIMTSLATPPMDREQVAEVCWNHPLTFIKGPLTGVSDPRVVAVILAAVVITLYVLLR